MVKLVGPGQAGVLLHDPHATGKGPIDTLFLAGTDPTRSTLSVTVKKAKMGDGLVNIGDIQGSGLKSLTATSSNLVGGGINGTNGIVLSGLLGSLKIHDILNGAGISAQGTAAQKTSIRAHVIADGTAIVVGSSLTSLTAASFGKGSVTAPSLGTLKITGDKAHGNAGSFAADLTLTGVAGKPALTTVVIAGTVSGATFNVAGSVGSFTAGAFNTSHLYGGFTPTTAGNPLGGGSFSGSFLLGSFRVTGFSGLVGSAFVNSVIAAPTVTLVSLKSVQTNNSGQLFGIVGHTVTEVTIQLPAFTWNNKHQVSALPPDFRVAIVGKMVTLYVTIGKTRTCTDIRNQLIRKELRRRTDY